MRCGVNRHRFLVPLTVLILFGCEDRAESPIETGRFAELTQVQLLVPSSGDGYDLSRASHLRTLSNGKVGVLNAGALEVLIFSPSGRLEDRFGRADQGPGEISRPLFMTSLPGDSISSRNSILSGA